MAGNPRWDFADMILGGREGKTCVIKHKHKDSDIMSHREDFLVPIWKKCVELAHDGNENVTQTLAGPAGNIVNKDFAYEFVDPELRERVRFRVSVHPSVDGEIFCMRRIAGNIPPLASQGFHPSVIQRMLQNKRRGLVLFGGEMGSGKTTAASAMIDEWLKQNGGSAVTLEDPPEYRLHGKHVNKETGVGGFCIQRATTAREMAGEIPSLMRACAPEIIFLGEIRESNVAREAMLAASNGHLVVSTIHGKGIDGAITRLISLSVSESLNAQAVGKILAEALSMVSFQQLERDPERNNLKTLTVTTADFDDSQRGTAMRSNVREGKLEQLANNYKKMTQQSKI